MFLKGKDGPKKNSSTVLRNPYTNHIKLVVNHSSAIRKNDMMSWSGYDFSFAFSNRQIALITEKKMGIANICAQSTWIFNPTT